MTRLRSFCDGLLEACWLTAVVSLPVYFNIFSNRIFEADKITVLRIIVAVMALAQFIKWEESRIDAGSEPAGRRRSAVPTWSLSNRLAVPALAVAASFLLSTAFSIWPPISSWGSYMRLQGTYSMLTFVALFFLVAANLSRRDQLERLLTTILLTSLPISLYALAQYFHLDPVSWERDLATRPASTLGNPIFLSAYLVMVVPITLQRLIACTSGLLSSRHIATGDAHPASGSAAKVAAMSFGGTIVVALFVLAVRQNPVVWWALLPTAGLLVVGGAVLASPRPTRLSTLLEAAGCLALLLLQLAAMAVAGSRGPLIGLATGAGFVLVVAARRYSRKLVVATTGVLAMGAALLVLSNAPGVPFVRDIPYLPRVGPWADTRMDTVRVRLLIWAGTGELLTQRPAIGLEERDPLGPARLLFGYGPESMFVAFNKVYQPELARYEVRNASPDRNHNDLLDYLLMVGLLGLATYLLLVISAFRLARQQLARAPDLPTYSILAGLVGALLGHVVELLSGIAIATTLSYFWVYLAILAALARGLQDAERSLPKEGPPPEKINGAKSAAIFAAFLLAVIAALSQIRGVERVPPAIAIAVSFAGLAVAVILAGRMLAQRAPGRFCRRSRTPIYLLAAAATFGIVLANLKVIAADVHFRLALASNEPEQLVKNVAHLNEALQLAGDQDNYYLHLGRAYLRTAELTPGSNALRGSLFEASAMALEGARALNPLNTDHYANLGRLYRIWGELDDPARLEQASDYYRQATTLSPRSAHLYDEWGQVDVAKGDLDAALIKTLKAAAIDPTFDWTFVLLGDIHLLAGRPQEALVAHRRALSISPATSFDSRFEQRIESYESLSMLPLVGDAYLEAVQRFPDSAEAHKGYAAVLVRRNRLREAAVELETSVLLKPRDWTSFFNLALTYKKLEMRDRAVASAEKALPYAPAYRTDELRRLIDELRSD